MYQYTAEPLLPWSDTDSDQRFNKVAQKVFIVFIILFLVIPFLPTPEIKKDKFDELPPRFARLLIKQAKPVIIKPKPKKIEKKKEVKKKVKKKTKKKAVKKKVTKKPKPKPKPTAKEVAQSAFSGISDELADLRDDFNVSALKNSPLKKATKKRKNTFDTSGVVKNASSGSRGIGSTKVNINSNTKLSKHNTVNVNSPIATTGNRTNRSSRSSQWSDEEIQLVFDRYKGSILSIYMRALRKDPGLQGKIFLKITLNASGNVIRIVVESSEVRSKSLVKRIKLRVKRFNFGAKPGASNFTFTYPLDLIPQ